MTEQRFQPEGFGAVIIGDELLSGKRQDRHLPKVIEMLTRRGLELDWVRYLGDDPVRLTRSFRETFATGDVVFSFGGIGGTPDDRTRQCAAEALGVPVEPHPEGLRELEAQFGPGGTPQRLRMVEFPQGARIIPNPVNRVPGFSCHHHHFVPGFPNMAWPMIEWVLDECYGHLHAVGSRTEENLVVHGVRESEMTPTLEAFTARYPGLKISCLPRWCPPDFELELGLRGPVADVQEALGALQETLSAQGWRWKSGRSRN